MKKIITILVLCCCSVQLWAQNAAIAAVKDVFTQYKKAILADKGAEAAKLIDSRTIFYYDSILLAIKQADSLQISKMTIMDKLMVLSVRHRATREEIMKFNGLSLFIYAIEKGMVGKSSVAANSIGTVTIDGNQAKGQLVVDGKASRVNFMFYKEAGVWKLNLTAIFPLGNVAFKQMVKSSGEEENVFILKLLDMMTGNEPSKDIWKPL